ncbi:MAG: hypothetical protein JWM21_4217 [Acidobacteria bacterium]|nr:hypothetical protein [Acidobacteriota bacterium]
MLSKIILCLFCLFLFAGGSLSARSQEPSAQATPTPDPELLKARRELDLQKLRTEAAEQKKKERAANLPDASNDPANKTLEGKITVEDKSNTFEIESVALSYESLSIIAREISGQVQNGIGDFNQLVIYSDTDFPNLVQYRFFESQAIPALDAYDYLLNKDHVKKGRGMGSEILSMPTIGTSFVKSAIDLISLFRTDTTISNRKVVIDETALGALVARELRSARPNYKVYFPKAYLPVYNWDPSDENSVLTQMTKLYSYQEVVKVVLEDYKDTAAAEKDKHVYHKQIPALTALNEQVNHLLANYRTKEGDPDTNRPAESAANHSGESASGRSGEYATSPIGSLLRAEALNQMLNSDPKTGVLQLKVLAAGGTEQTTRNLILGSKIRHSGSAIIEYLLFDQNGVLHSSEVLYHHTGFQKMQTARTPR